MSILIGIIAGAIIGFLLSAIFHHWKGYERAVDRQLESIQSRLDDIDDRLPIIEGKDFINIDRNEENSE